MVIAQTKTTKKLRITLCVLFLIQIFLLSFPFIWGEVEGKTEYFSGLEMMFNFTRMNDSGLNTAGWISFIFLAIPLIGFLTASFDKTRNIKNFAGIISAFFGVLSIVYLIGGANIALGSMLSLLVYLAIAFFSVLGMLARVMKSNS